MQYTSGDNMLSSSVSAIARSGGLMHRREASGSLGVQRMLSQISRNLTLVTMRLLPCRLALSYAHHPSSLQYKHVHGIDD
ncbi:hypothetical protein RB213_012217 [Colletotrichum asianum]